MEEAMNEVREYSKVLQLKRTEVGEFAEAFMRSEHKTLDDFIKAYHYSDCTLKEFVANTIYSSKEER